MLFVSKLIYTFYAGFSLVAWLPVTSFRLFGYKSSFMEPVNGGIKAKAAQATTMDPGILNKNKATYYWLAVVQKTIGTAVSVANSH